MNFVGVDGCRGGWLSCRVEGREAVFAVRPDFEAVWREHGDARLLLVDIPIGLPGRLHAARKADAEARRVLGKRHSCVFSPGVRELAGCVTYSEACKANRKLTGKKISKQYWNIKNKVESVDSFLCATPSALRIVREAHPEVLFSLAGGGVSLPNKRTRDGQEARLAILQKFIMNIEGIVKEFLQKSPRSTFGTDDALDAAILAVAAQESRGKLRSLPDPPEQDDLGLPMAIWYHDFSSAP
ncbi:DUF429 domain-containing protein [Pseudodesulfovibrio cashew]|uniref:DUF429 domain-containing protein n=1 Tax=Pseudodesulfovibrio cashew TaxID=2678688 RepID=A0A6I6JPQ3_9BACT|nr:DUF429 domain-containing protein [Pseudodesulfovibrio cashew]QGY39614.1 DUF429 domain-containing protein [Pseudodesulfovibrio cashew]